MQKVNFKTTQGILEEIELSANEFLKDQNVTTTTTRLSACDKAIKIHALEHMKERFQTMKLERQNKMALLGEDTFV